MQVKPFFNKSFSILEKHYVTTDDTGAKYYLTHYIGEKETTNTIKDKRFVTVTILETTDEWRVMREQEDKYANGSAGFEERLFWKDKKKKLTRLFYNGMDFQEVEDGQHSMFWPLEDSSTPGVKLYSDYGLATRFVYKGIAS